MIATGPRRARPPRLPARRWAPRRSTPPADGPAAPAAALASLHRPDIYLLGAPGVSASTLAALGRLGRVSKIAPAEGAQAGASEGADPVDNAVAVARFSDGSFGWGVREAGHGL